MSTMDSMLMLIRSSLRSSPNSINRCISFSSLSSQTSFLYAFPDLFSRHLIRREIVCCGITDSAWPATENTSVPYDLSSIRSNYARIQLIYKCIKEFACRYNWLTKKPFSIRCYNSVNLMHTSWLSQPSPMIVIIWDCESG
jgi:hypothetical protein